MKVILVVIIIVLGVLFFVPIFRITVPGIIAEDPAQTYFVKRFSAYDVLKNLVLDLFPKDDVYIGIDEEL